MTKPAFRFWRTRAARGTRPANGTAAPRQAPSRARAASISKVFACSTTTAIATSKTPNRSARGFDAGEAVPHTERSARFSEQLLSRAVARAIVAAIHFWVKLETLP